MWARLELKLPSLDDSFHAVLEVSVCSFRDLPVRVVASATRDPGMELSQLRPHNISGQTSRPCGHPSQVISTKSHVLAAQTQQNPEAPKSGRLNSQLRSLALQAPTAAEKRGRPKGVVEAEGVGGPTTFTVSAGFEVEVAGLVGLRAQIVLRLCG